MMYPQLSTPGAHNIMNTSGVTPPPRATNLVSCSTEGSALARWTMSGVARRPGIRYGVIGRRITWVEVDNNNINNNNSNAMFNNSQQKYKRCDTW